MKKKKILQNAKKDIISDDEFTKMNLQKPRHHYVIPEDVIPEDENIDQLQETLIGMEYDIESDEDYIGKGEEAIPDEDLEYLLSENEYEDEEYDEDEDDDEEERPIELSESRT